VSLQRIKQLVRRPSTEASARPPRRALDAASVIALVAALAIVLVVALAVGCERDTEEASTESASESGENAENDPSGEPDEGNPANPWTAAARETVDALNAELDATAPGTREAPVGWLELVEVSSLPRGGDALVHARLDNGLEIFVIEDHSAPVVAYQTWFRAGSRHDPPGLEGLAHVLEHLMFRRTKSLEDGEFDREMERWGIDPSAYTWLDYTYYFQKLPSDRLAHVAAIEADRMANLHIDETLVDAEREVVLSERRYRVDNDPVGAMLEIVYQAGFPHHPYQHQPVGTHDGLNAITVEDAQLFYRAYYHPANAAIVLVGDVELAAALRTLREAYGAIPGRTPRELPHDDAPMPKKRQSDVLAMPIEAELMVLAFPSPALATPEHATMKVLDNILFATPYGLLYRDLKIDRELVTRIEGWVGEFEFRALYEISIAMRPGESHEPVRARVLEALANVGRTELPDVLIERAQANLELEFLEDIQEFNGRAEGVGHWWATRNAPAEFFATVEAYRDVTAEDLKTTAARLFKPNHLNEVLGRIRDYEAEASPAEVEGSAGGPR